MIAHAIVPATQKHIRIDNSQEIAILTLPTFYWILWTVVWDRNYFVKTTCTYEDKSLTTMMFATM